MNFGNPERPEIMGQFVGAIEGMKEACEALKYPVVSGNVSLYNETNGVAIPPTPAIGGVGLIPDLAKTASIALKAEGNLLVVIGREDGHLGQSLYQLILVGKVEGAPPPVDLADEIKAGNLVRTLIREGKVGGVHDVSDGGLLVAVAEMALAGEIGVQLFPYEGKLPVHAAWFGEDQGRYVVEPRRSSSRRSSSARACWHCPPASSAASAADSLALKGEASLPSTICGGARGLVAGTYMAHVMFC